jgi:hypothetical protein
MTNPLSDAAQAAAQIAFDAAGIHDNAQATDPPDAFDYPGNRT